MSDTTLPVRHLFRIDAKIDTPAPQVIAGPNGMRAVAVVSGGTFSGERLSGTIPDGFGADAPLFRPDGSLRIDVRLVLITDDGVRIYVTYNGVAIPDGSGGLTLRTAPTFEAPDGPYAWLNNIQAIGLGTSGDGALHYDVYEML